MYKEEHMNFLVGAGLGWVATAVGSFVLPRLV
jgi:hypothetical protein